MSNIFKYLKRVVYKKRNRIYNDAIHAIYSLNNQATYKLYGFEQEYGISKIKVNVRKKTITYSTNKPGHLIGARGKNIDFIQNIICARNPDYKVLIVEVKPLHYKVI